MTPGTRDTAIILGIPTFLYLGFVFTREWIASRRRQAVRRANPPVGLTFRDIRQLARPTLLLVPARAAGFSKLGGSPELPDGMPWPMGEHEPRTFVAQIDLAAIPPDLVLDWLPKEGRIYAFFDEERNGAADCVQLHYSVEPPGAAAQPPMPISGNRRFGERKVACIGVDSIPSLDWLELGYGNIEIEEKYRGQLESGVNLLDEEVEHRIGGFPGEIQNIQMQIECEYMWRGGRRDWNEPAPDAVRRASREWRLLLQIDSDPALDMNWWDAGRLYVFIRKRDAMRADFSKTVTITQTH